MEMQIKNKTYSVRNTFRAVMFFERLTGKSFALSNATDILLFFYSCYMAAPGSDAMEFDEFICELDESPNLLGDFTQMLQTEQAVACQFPSEKRTGKKKVKERP